MDSLTNLESYIENMKIEILKTQLLPRLVLDSRSLMFRFSGVNSKDRFSALHTETFHSFSFHCVRFE